MRGGVEEHEISTGTKTAGPVNGVAQPEQTRCTEALKLDPNRSDLFCDWDIVCASVYIQIIQTI